MTVKRKQNEKNNYLFRSEDMVILENTLYTGR